MKIWWQKEIKYVLLQPNQHKRIDLNINNDKSNGEKRAT